jgi:hypothetical protein
MPQPSHLEGARFSFTQVSLLARSLSPSALLSLTKPWTLIAKLTTLRSAMAHKLDPAEAKIEGYKALVVSTISSDKDAECGSFAPALDYPCGFLSCHRVDPEKHQLGGPPGLPGSAGEFDPVQAP